jgi:hypothetical protein
MRHTHQFKPGDPVVFRKSKRSSHPGPRAAHIDPEPRGEQYSYVVDKFWVVSEVRSDGSLLVRTRRGKTHVLRPDHPSLRRANLLDRLFRATRFPRLSDLPPVGQLKPRVS